MPSISVIVPVYKVEKYLARCVDSILHQSFSDFELILVDDGSPDRCGEICDDYARQDSRVRVIHQQNGGLSAARNSGIDLVRREKRSHWIAFVDSDDWIHPEYLMKLYRAAAETECLISVCGFFPTDGKAFPACESGLEVMSADAYYCSREIHGGIPAVAWNKLYHSSLFEEIRYPAGKLHEDEFVTYRLVYAAKRIAVIPEVLYAYFQNAEGIMLSKWNPRRLHVLEALEQQMAFAQETGNENLRNKAVLQYILSIHQHLEKASEEYRPGLRQKYRAGLKLGRETGVFPGDFDHLWAYEEAYPAKLFWWVFFKGHAAWTKLAGRKQKDA